jgi:hypothetical protein
LASDFLTFPILYRRLTYKFALTAMILVVALTGVVIMNGERKINSVKKKDSLLLQYLLLKINMEWFCLVTGLIQQLKQLIQRKKLQQH